MKRQTLPHSPLRPAHPLLLWFLTMGLTGCTSCDVEWVISARSYWISFLLLLILAYIVFRIGARSLHHASRRLLEEGENAIRHNEQVEDILRTTGGLLWRLEENGDLYLHSNFFSTINIPERVLTLQEMLQHIPEAEHEKVCKAVERCHDEVQESYFHVTIYSTGQTHYFKTVMKGLTRKDGSRFVSGISISQDRYQQSLEELREAHRIEEESNTKTRFLACMGHEISTPLSAIVGYSNLLLDMRDTATDEEMKAYYQEISKNNQLLLSIIDRVMKLSTDQDEMTLQLQDYSVTHLMNDIYMTYNVIVPKHLGCHYVKDEQDVHIMVNRTSVIEVLSNLINNAIKFTPVGHITIGWKHEGDKVKLYVEDTGIGIRKADLSAIFKGHYKSDSMSQGAGIGLRLCDRLVKAMGGTIHVQSTYGKGSRFEVIFDAIPEA